MNILLDTHMLIWAALDRLPPKASTYILDASNKLFFSPVNIWEIVIKQGIDKTAIKIDVQSFYTNLKRQGYEELAVTSEHALAVAALPAIHKDPFDRMLLAQAIVADCMLLTADSLLRNYPQNVLYGA